MPPESPPTPHEDNDKRPSLDQTPAYGPPVFDSQPFSGDSHPFADMMPKSVSRPDMISDGPPLFNDAYASARPPRFEMPPPVMQAIEGGYPVRFSSAAENVANHREPDYFFTTEGKMVPNPKATPSPDGSINIEIQTKEAAHKSLKDAIMYESELQKAAAKEMIRLWQEDNPGKPVPGWMDALANAEPNLPSFTPFPPTPETPVTPPPENGFVPRGVSGSPGGGGGSSGGSGDGGFSGFAGNGGFDNQGYFRGNGGNGDGAIPTGGMDSRGAPLGEGEKVAAKQIYDRLTEKHGLTPAQASGILGNIQTESGFKTDAFNKGEGAIGLCQWRGGRRENLENFAAQEGKPVTNWEVQVDFMMHEMKTSEKGAFQQLQSTETPQQAAAVFDKYFERSSGEARGQRMAQATNFHNQFA